MEAEGFSYSVGHPFTYKWHVKDIQSIIECASKDEVIMNSPEFSASAKIKNSWFIQLTCSRYSGSVITGMELVLYPKNGGQQIRTKYGIYLINNGNNKIQPSHKGFNTAYLIPENKIFKSSPSNSIYFTARNLLLNASEFIQNDTLVIGVDLTVYDLMTINNPINSLKCSKRKITDDLEDLFITKRKSDIVIKVGDEKYNAHKFILTARSNVFEAMFSCGMNNNKRNVITISDIFPIVFEKLLEYIYTDKVEFIDIFAEELLESSDKYQLQGLKDLCEESLSTSFTVENAVRVMLLAERHSAKRLKKAAITYILINFTDVKNTEDFKVLEKSQPSVAVKLFRKYIDNINK